MLYGIDYRNFHTAIHGILLFSKQSEAERSLEILKAYDEQGEFDESTSHFIKTEVMDKTVGVIEEIHYNLIKPLMTSLSFAVNVKGRVSSLVSNVRIINPNIAIDIQ